MSIKDTSIFSSGGHFVQWNALSKFGKGHYEFGPV